MIVLLLDAANAREDGKWELAGYSGAAQAFKWLADAGDAPEKIAILWNGTLGVLLPGFCWICSALWKLRIRGPAPLQQEADGEV